MITVHWVNLLVVFLLAGAGLFFFKESDECTGYGFPLTGCLTLLIAIIVSMALLLAKSWGWV